MARLNRIFVGARVKGSHGNFIPNPRGHKRRIREQLTGRVLEAVGHQKWKVRFDIDGREKVCHSNTLSVTDSGEGVPVDEELPTRRRGSESSIEVRVLVNCCVVVSHFFYLISSCTAATVLILLPTILFFVLLFPGRRHRSLR